MVTYENRLPRAGMTARQLSEKVGRTPRTIQRWTSEPRAEYEGRAQKLREDAVRLRLSGVTYQQIADELDVPLGTVKTTLHRARKAGLL